MNDVLVDVLRHELSKEQLLLGLRSEVIGLRREVVRVLVRHQVKVVLLDALNDLGALDTVAVLEEGLQDSASVVLEHKLGVLRADELQALIDNSVLLLIRDLRLLLLD